MVPGRINKLEAGMVWMKKMECEVKEEMVMEKWNLKLARWYEGVIKILRDGRTKLKRIVRKEGKRRLESRLRYEWTGLLNPVIQQIKVIRSRLDDGVKGGPSKWRMEKKMLEEELERCLRKFEIFLNMTLVDFE